MSNELVKYAFVAGEISPTLFGRTDLTKYDLAMAEAHNYFVDYRGGLSSRPGFEFCDFVALPEYETRMHGFQFNPELSNTYLVQFGDGYIRFMQDGAYVLEAPKTITGLALGIVTSAAHGLVAGRWVKLSGLVGPTILNGRTFIVGAVTPNTFQLLDVITGATPSGLPTYVSGGLATPVYEITSPYASADIPTLKLEQYRDLLRITHGNYPVQNLIRNDHADWALVDETFTPDLGSPEVVSGSGTAPDLGTDPPQKEAQTIFTVTSVNANGDESVNGNLYRLDGIVNYTVFEGSVTVSWNAEPDAVSYNVYRSIVASEATLLDGSQLGYVGQTRGTSFTDSNITPDFTKGPPIKNDPFAPGHVKRIAVTDGGTGYTEFDTTVSLTGGGSGFEGDAVVSDSGEIVNVIIKNPGSGYTSPTVVFTGSGTGADGTAEVAPLVGTYPALSAVFQQRQTYAASLEQPITVWGSRYKRFSNFDSSALQLDNDSYEFDLDTAAIAPIRHMLVARGGLLLFTQDNIWMLNGGGNNAPLTPTNALAEPQTYTGITTLAPIRIDSDVLYREGKGYAVRLLSYSEQSRVYGGEDKSILSNHLFGFGKDIVRWAYQESPFKVVWSVREDGALLAFTVVKPEDVYAWTPCETRGKFLDILAIREGISDRIYVTTLRKVQGRFVKFIERMSLREFTNVEDAWCVDAGLALGGTYPGGELTIIRDGDDWRAQTPTAAFSVADIGKYLRVANGIFKVLTFNSTTELGLHMYEPPENWIKEFGEVETWPTTDWSLDAAITELSGLWHLEGEEVAILADGNVFPRQVVADGTVTLPQPVTRAIVGLPYRCQARSLPVTVPNAAIESRRKRIVGIGVRLDKSRGLSNGLTLDQLYPMRERTDEPMGRPTRLVNGIKYQMISTNWDENGQTYFVLDDPLPVTILSLVFDMEVGDDPE